MPRPKKLLTTGEIAERYRIHPRTVVRWIRERDLRAIRVGGRWRVEEADLEAFLVVDRFRLPASYSPSGSEAPAVPPAVPAAAATMSSTTR